MGKFATKRRKKRQFTGNRFTKRPRVDNEEGGDVQMPEKDAGKKISSVEGETNNEHMASGNSASFGKLQQLINERSNDKTLDNSGKDITGFRLCDMGLIADVFCLLKCPECDCVGLSLEEDDVSRKGCASKLRLCCQNCNWKHLFWTSKRTEKSFEVLKQASYLWHAENRERSCRGLEVLFSYEHAITIMNMPSKSYKYGSGLPKSIIKLVKPVFQRLSDNSLLEKCLHGKTQNQNEALNALIWQRIPKEVFVHRDSLEFGVYDAVLHFNIGCNAIVELFKSMNIPAGKYTELACQAEDKSRVLLAQYKSTPRAKKRRKVIRGLEKKKEDKNQEAEGLQYGAGEF